MQNSLLAGTFAALGSFCGKLPGYLMTSAALPTMKTPGGPQDWQWKCVSCLLYALPMALMVTCNLLNWRFYLRALQTAEQTLTATVLTAAANYLVTFLLGYIVFGESVSMLTIAGSTLIVLGIWMLCGREQQHEETAATAGKSSFIISSKKVQ